MHCIRRAALRAACSSSRFVAVPRQQVAANALQISKANLQPTAVLPLTRYFSQTVRVAEGQKEAIEAEESSSTSDDLTPLQSSPTETERAMEKAATIFISNITFEATDVHLTEAFGKYGNIAALNIARDGRGLSRGFAFITFEDKESADRAIKEANNSFWHGRRILVAHRKEPLDKDKTKQTGPRDPTDSLYIGNIPYETSDADLNALFRRLEGVKDVRVAVDRNTGWPRGFAHADFEDIESATKGYELLSEHTLGGRKLRVDYAARRRTGPGATST